MTEQPLKSIADHGARRKWALESHTPGNEC